MNDAMQAAVIEELVKVAPDIDPATVDATAHLQEDLELDSMDFLNLAAALSVRFGIEIAEADYPRLATVADAAAFLSAAGAKSQA